MTNEVAPKAPAKKLNPKFSKAAILSSGKYGGYADLMTHSLKDEVLYTMDEVDQIFQTLSTKKVVKKINK